MAPPHPPPRLVVDRLAPVVDGGRQPVKRVVGEPVVAEATVYADGHDRLRVVLAHKAPGGRWVEHPMVAVNPGLDRWSATFTPSVEGEHRFRVLAWIDRFGTWIDGTTRKLEAGLDLRAELLEGAALLDAAASAAPTRDRAALAAAAEQLRAGDLTPLTDQGGGPGRPSALELVHRTLRRGDAVGSPTVPVLVERERALFAAWYELFPRSWGPAPGVHGTLADVEAALDYVAELGFDVLYLPPIHPIGTTHRKGRNNTEQALPGDPGSPWAIGGPDGGHTAVHAELGTEADLERLVATAAANGIELALDIAFQCSPDHPWVTDHPDWFRHRPDGSIQYAENPPKKYQDIYPLDFECDDWHGLWEACRGVVLHWAACGVRIFRVDNPHTKPFAFWAWLIEEVRARHPDALFLSEAFTRPEIVHRLAMVGFTQSYTYFPWRQTAAELTEYFTELSTSPSVDELRPSCWPNTPDILTHQLAGAPRAQFAVRAFLAALLSPGYGIYGPAFELCDNTAAGNGKEEYLDAEKYQLRWWDRTDPSSLAPLLRVLNRARRDHLALHTLRTLRFHPTTDDALLCWSKTPHGGPVTDPAAPAEAPIVCVANLDPVEGRAGVVDIDVAALGVDPGRAYTVHDLLTDTSYTWWGTANYVELHPDRAPGHVLRIQQEPA